MSLLDELKAKYPLTISQKEVDEFVAGLKAKQQEYYNNAAVQQTIFSCIDLTTLKQTDSKKSVTAFVEKVNQFAKDYPMYTNVGGICVYPNFSEIYKSTLKVAGVNKAVVAGGFPSSQTFKEIKVLESKMAVEAGATEVDIVIPVGEMLGGNVEQVFDEVKSVKAVLPNNHLKVILETGVLTNIETIWYASVAAMEAGADFIKTSTGKEQQGDADSCVRYVFRYKSIQREERQKRRLQASRRYPHGIRCYALLPDSRDLARQRADEGRVVPHWSIKSSKQFAQSYGDIETRQRDRSEILLVHRSSFPIERMTVNINTPFPNQERAFLF